ncbi:hypothetical protein JCM19239_4823 [Vibrio variabilis]|uniref:Uncharacterized protein n=1 Tax=Vibrio variabilis TaxID=990271 RepID=A0ABQ0JGK8_9VIBR|nr:hypothetical protein JCM19239_4823 [Vibrio variabilis]
MLIFICTFLGVDHFSQKIKNWLTKINSECSNIGLIRM